LDGACAYHDATNRGGSDNRKFSHHDDIIRKYYSIPDSTNHAGVIDYIRKSQILNYEVYRADIEAINRQLWDKASGIVLWKSNAAWPSLTWQIYDWYMQSHAGFFGTKKAGEMVHIQMNRDDYKVIVLNSLHEKNEGTKILSVLYDSKMVKLWEKQENLDLTANSVTKTEIVVPVDKKLSFLKLELKDKMGKLISDNFYWLQADDDYTELNTLQPAVLTGNSNVKSLGGRTLYEVSVTNTGKSIAFLVELKLQGKESGQEVLPSLWSDNYFSLLPGESKMVTLNINTDDLQETSIITAKAYNMAKEEVLKY
jgi:exo-1,4-beta-D-glucosaminidase